MRTTAILLGAALVLSGCGNSVKSGMKSYNQGRVDVAVRKWLEEAKEGNAAAQNNLGMVYLDKYHKPDDAANWFYKAAQQGNLPGMTNLGRMQLDLGHQEAGLSWLNLAARWNFQPAINVLRVRGFQVPDPDLAIQKQQQAAAEQQQLRDNILSGLLLVGAAAALSKQGTGQRPVVYPPAPSMRPSTNRTPMIYPGAQLCPNGTYVLGTCQLAPDGSYVGGTPTLAPNGRYVGSNSGRVTLCPDGSYVGGGSCKLMPDGQYIGGD